MKFGVIGAGGYWGPNWVRVLKQLNVLGVVCDSHPGRLDQVVHRFELTPDVGATTRYEEVLNSDVDGVFVVTPPVTHAVLAVAALKHGKHVFIEKPLARTLEECFEIKVVADSAHRIVMVGHTFVYHPAIRKFKESLTRVGDLRTIYTVRTNFGQYQASGIIYDLLPHDLSIFNYLCGVPIKLSAEVSPDQDVAFVRVQYPDVLCTAFLSWSYPDKTRKLAAVGSQGILEWDLGCPHLQFHRKRVEVRAEKYQHFDDGTVEVAVHDQSEPLMNEALHFIECIRKDEAPLTGLVDGISVVRGLEDACR